MDDRYTLVSNNLIINLGKSNILFFKSLSKVNPNFSFPSYSFDSHDPGVYTATTVTGLLEHYKDPSCVMFFEPMLTLPLHRNFVFSLQELSRATIVSHTTYDGIDQLSVPKMLKSYLKEYHYKQRVHVKRLDEYQDS